MPEATDKIAAQSGNDNADPARRALLDLEPTMTALNGAAAVLVLATAGIAARREHSDMAPWEGEGLGYLAQHIHDLAETAASIVEARRPAWRVGQPFRAILRPEESAA
ncbi:hypothetical protein [Falsiroseomonas oryzae]|uniref:hypothetical protein n=1 Tax=Falsiroseomonas oryzae TaxID=2766473 RepID=UPI0022EA70CF|nr:hypothetical protein [Roseomonas sp. MO-31]